MHKFIFIGSESTGKTTMCKLMSERYKIPWLEEACRILAEKAGTISAVGEGFGFTRESFVEMANIHNENERQQRQQRQQRQRSAVICDNDSFAVEIWCKRYLGYMDDDVRKLYDEIVETDEQQSNKRIYFLFKPNVPFVQDGYRDGEHIREQMYQDFISELSARKLSYYIVGSPSFSERENYVSRIIDSYLY